MPAQTCQNANILVASDNANDAALIEELLKDEYPGVASSTNPEAAPKEVDQQRPDVLILAFNVLEKAKHYYLALYRQCDHIQKQPHRTIVLCTKEEVKLAYALCRDGIFDDYVLFWPISHDVTRLHMVIHHALRELMLAKEEMPTLADIAAQARHLAEVKATLDRRMAQGGEHIEKAKRDIEQAEQEIGKALDDFSQRLVQGALADAVATKDAGGLETEIGRIKRDEIQQRIRATASSIEPLSQWMNDVKQEYEPHLESARSLNSMADRVRPLIMVVDDDESQRDMLVQILGREKYRLITVASAVEMVSVLRKMRPDLILMDVMMPEMDGVEATRRLKAVPRYANIPVIMVTGNSEKNVVVTALKMGAADFIVKPFIREILISKVASALSSAAPSQPPPAGPDAGSEDKQA